MHSGETERELIDVAASLEYAAKLIKQGNFLDAEPIYRRALDVLERAYGAGDPDTIACLQSLGDIYYQTGRYNEAMPHYKRLLAIGEKVLGKKHPSVVDMVLRLAATCQQLGLNEDAETLFRRANQMSMSSMAALSRPVPDAKPSIKNEPSSSVVSPASLPGQSNSRNAKFSRFSDDDQLAPPKKPSKDKKNKDINQQDAMQGLLISLQRSSGVLMSLVVVGALIFCAYLVFGVLNSSSARPSQLNHLKNTAYKTADAYLDLVISPNGEPSYKVGSQAYASTITAMGPDLMDFKDSILSSLLNKEIWFEETPLGLQREDGTVLYSKNSPEMKVVRQLDMIGRVASSWFQQRREYPHQRGDIQLVGDLGQNVVSGRPEAPSIDKIENGTTDVQEVVDVPVVNMPVEKILESTENAKWLKESAGYPGAIHCLSVVHKLATGDVREFYAHGFDRNSKFIAGSIPGTIYLVAMSNGKQYVPDHPKAAKAGRPPKICIVKLPNSNTPLWMIHYFTPLFCAGFAVVFFLGGRLGKSKNDSMSVGTRIGLVFAFIALFWVISYFVP